MPLMTRRQKEEKSRQQKAQEKNTASTTSEPPSSTIASDCDCESDAICDCGGPRLLLWESSGGCGWLSPSPSLSGTAPVSPEAPTCSLMPCTGNQREIWRSRARGRGGGRERGGVRERERCMMMTRSRSGCPEPTPGIAYNITNVSLAVP